MGTSFFNKTEYLSSLNEWIDTYSLNTSDAHVNTCEQISEKWKVLIACVLRNLWIDWTGGGGYLLLSILSVIKI